MNWDNIDKYTFKYRIAFFLVNIWLRVYYKKIVVNGIENIPENTPLIFAPSHQNALMDALAVLLPLKSNPVFLARSDVFSSKIVSKLLKFCKIMPVYRIRDGFDTLQKNEEIFQQSIKVLENRNKLVILPEGSHAGFRRLRALKKGIFRIAFKAEENNNFNLGLKIIPAGLDYSNYYKFNQVLYINYGKPIEVKKYMELYKENEQKGYKGLMDELSDSLKAVMVNIENERYYKLYDELREIYKYKMQEKLGFNSIKQPNKFICDKKLIEILDKHYIKNPEVFQWLDNKVKTYVRFLKKLNFRNWLLNKNKYSFILIFFKSIWLFITFPVFLYGFINNYLPFQIPVMISGKKVKDKQFVSTFNFGLGIVFFHLFYLFQIIAVSIIFKNIWITLGYFISLIPSGILAYKYYVAFKKLNNKFRYNWLMLTKNRALLELTKVRNEIFDKLDSIINLYL